MVYGVYLAEPDTVLVFRIYLRVFGDGTRLAMPKTIYAPDSSSLKPGSGATEGVLRGPRASGMLTMGRTDGL